MGGLKLDEEIHRHIIKTWQDMTQHGAEPTANEVRKEYVKLQKKGIYKDVRTPKLRTFQEKIREAKKRLSQNTLLEEWSMASLIQNVLPPESIPCVVRVWRYAAASNEKFTVMQAKWVSLIYPIIKQSPYLRSEYLDEWEQTVDLWYLSSWYSEIEKDSLITGLAFTFEPDKKFMTDWEIGALTNTGYFKNIRFGESRPVFFHNDGHTVQELLHYHDYWQVYSFRFEPELPNEPQNKLLNLIKGLPSLDSSGFDDSSKLVYLRYFTHLIRGKKWEVLSPDVAIELIIKLRNWVLEEHKKIEKDPHYINFMGNKPDGEILFPSELFDKVEQELAYEHYDENGKEERQ